MSDRLAKAIAAAISSEIETVVRRELQRMSLTTADADRAAYIDAKAYMDSGMPNPNKARVRQAANDLVLRLEGDAGRR